MLTEDPRRVSAPLGVSVLALLRDRFTVLSLWSTGAFTISIWVKNFMTCERRGREGHKT